MKGRFSPLLPAALVFALALGTPMASWAGPGGGEGQRFRCNGDGESAHNPPLSSCRVKKVDFTPPR